MYFLLKPGLEKNDFFFKSDFFLFKLDFFNLNQIFLIQIRFIV